MTRNSNGRVIVDFESFVDSLLSYTKKNNCCYLTIDLLDEFSYLIFRLITGTLSGTRTPSYRDTIQFDGLVT